MTWENLHDDSDSRTSKQKTVCWLMNIIIIIIIITNSNPCSTSRFLFRKFPLSSFFMWSFFAVPNPLARQSSISALWRARVIRHSLRKRRMMWLGGWRKPPSHRNEHIEAQMTWQMPPLNVLLECFFLNKCFKTCGSKDFLVWNGSSNTTEQFRYVYRIYTVVRMYAYVHNYAQTHTH